MRPAFFLFSVVLFIAVLPLAQAAIPAEKAFVNPRKFEQLVNRGVKEQWRKLPIGERTARAGLALVGTPYVNFTLELDDRHETPCVNMDGMDCWTFFETALGTARAFSVSERPAPRDLLRMIELERYRGGKCDGTFVSRLHHLEDWSYDNEKRGLVEDLTPRLPGAKKLQREMAYMGKNWKSFRQLRANPKLVPAMQKLEAEISRRGIYYIPKASVPAIEKYLQNGDVISIVTTWPGTYTSHVGLAYRDNKKVLRFLHASRNHRKVLVDERLSTYLNNNRKHMGIMVARPKDVTVRRGR
jgi:RNase H-fold protein (predicted Holliday junction resolvase)